VCADAIFQRGERRDIAKGIVSEKGPALKEPKLSGLEAEFDVPGTRLSARAEYRFESCRDLLTCRNDLLQLIRLEHRVATCGRNNGASATGHQLSFPGRLE